MSKLSLKLEDLTVDSFQTERPGRAKGTVGAFSIVDPEPLPGKPEPIDSARWSCRTCETCDDSVCRSCYFNTCYEGCQDTA